jgi:hypothetical protein
MRISFNAESASDPRIPGLLFYGIGLHTQTKVPSLKKIGVGVGIGVGFFDSSISTPIPIPTPTPMRPGDKPFPLSGGRDVLLVQPIEVCQLLHLFGHLQLERGYGRVIFAGGCGADAMED